MPPESLVGVVAAPGSDAETLARQLAVPRLDALPAAGLVLIHDVWGLTDHARDLAQGLSGEGFAVLAHDAPVSGREGSLASVLSEVAEKVDAVFAKR